MKTTLSKKEENSEEFISISNDLETNYWANRFGISTDELKRAVVDAGTRVRQVKTLLEKQQLN